MKDIFSPIFLLTMIFLFIFHQINIFSSVIQPFVFIFFLIAFALFFKKKYKLSYIFITISISFLISIAFVKGKNEFYQKIDTKIDESQYISIKGKLRDFPEIRRNHSILYLQTECLEYNKKKHFHELNIRIKVNGNLEQYYRGDKVKINARIYKNRFSRNFYPSPFEDYVLSRKIHFNGYCKSKQLLTLLEKTNVFWRIIGVWRNKVRTAIEKKFTDSGGKTDEKGVFLEAILIGDRGKIDNKMKNGLLSAGVFHLIAISGAHIGIIAVFSLVLLKFFKISFRKRYITTAVFILLFLILSGFKISAQRAVLMALLIFFAKVSYLDINIFNIVSFSGLMILVKNPAEFLDAGFILTYTLTAAIIMGRKIFVPLFSKIPGYLREFFSANISASIISLPLSLLFFKRYSFACLLSGLILFPLTAIITGLAILLLPVAPISPFVSNILMVIIKIPLVIFFKVVGFFTNSLNLNIHRASPSIFAVILTFVAFYFLTKKYHRFFKTSFAVLLIILISFISIEISHHKPANLERYFLDVGQGDSSVIVFPKGNALLIDGGGTYFSDFEIGKQIVLPFILQKRIKIKWVSVSHYHPDHSEGIIEIINILKPEELWISSEAKKDLFYKNLINTLHKSIKIKKLSSGFSKTVEKCKIEILFPESFITEDYSNNNSSQVLKISNDSHSFLFTGDIEKMIETKLIKKNCKKLKADVLKVPHHGSRTSSSIPFLECIIPEIGIFSYAHNNRFKFPNKEVIKNYKDRMIKMLSTAKRGGIKIISYPGSLKIETSR